MSLVQERLNRIIESGRLSHTYMFEGDAIESLKYISVWFAVQILGNDKRTQQLVETRNHPDFYYLKTDNKTIKKEEVQALVRAMNNKPIASNYKVYIIEAFDKLTTQAENSLLKFLEEPPERTIALLLTMDKSNILPTIHSRSQHIHVNGINANNSEHIEFLNEDELNTVHTLSLNIEHIKELDTQFKTMRQKVIEFSNLWLKNEDSVLLEIKPLLELCNEPRDYMLILQLFDGYIRQIMHRQLGINIWMPFKEQQERTTTLKVTQSQCVNMLQEIETANKMLQSNVNPTLVFEGMVICSKG